MKILSPITMMSLVLGFLFNGQVPAQNITILHTFSNSGDGAEPEAGLILSGNILYGTAGNVFKLNTDGTSFGTLYPFDGSQGGVTGLALSGNVLFGMTHNGGNADGTIFAVNTDGTEFNTIYYFSGSDGGNPFAALISFGGTLYGAAGNVFKVHTDGSSFANIYSFTATQGPVGPWFLDINNDGALPMCQLLLSNNKIYGTAAAGGHGGSGTVFKVNMDGTGFGVLYTFSAMDTNTYANSDGANPRAGLILSGNMLYGTTYLGGKSGNGTVFKVNVDGSGFGVLHSFTGGYDGANPQACLILSGNTLYGTAVAGGFSGNSGPYSGSGTIFKINIDGTDFTTLYSFTGLDNNFSNTEGANPYGGLVLSGNTLCGTTHGGGPFSFGTVFSISLPISRPNLIIRSAGPNTVLTWPTNSGITLQSTTNLGSSVWTTNSSAPFVVGGQNTMTIPFAGTQQFFRLSQ